MELVEWESDFQCAKHLFFDPGGYFPLSTLPVDNGRCRALKFLG